MKQFFYFSAAAEVAQGFADDFQHWLGLQPSDRPITIALSGGSTPQAVFELWATKYRDAIDWQRLHFFWGDERCVPANSSESNFGTAKRIWLDQINIPRENVYPIDGDKDPQQASQRYEQLVKQNVKLDETGIPRFDLVMLGMGTDGHFASIFPHQLDLLHSSRVCEVAEHPDTGQQRITLTGPIINNARRIAFLITGQNKKAVFDLYRRQGQGWENLPISHVHGEQVDFFLEDCLKD